MRWWSAGLGQGSKSYTQRYIKPSEDMAACFMEVF